MEIKLIKQSCVFIKGKKETILINPEPGMLKNNSSRIVVYNQPKYEELRTIGEKVSIMGPGEYEMGGVEIDGFNGGEGNTIYTILIDGVSIGIVGKLKEELSDKKTDKISGVDVLIVDVVSKNILKLGKVWGANYIIPVGDDKVAVDKFLNESDNEGLEAVEGLKVDKDALPDGTEIVLLKETN